MKPYKRSMVVNSSNTCDIASQTQSSSDICEQVKSNNKVILLKTESKRLRNDKDLDQALKDTFPASDAIAKYL